MRWNFLIPLFLFYMNKNRTDETNRYWLSRNSSVPGFIDELPQNIGKLSDNAE